MRTLTKERKDLSGLFDDTVTLNQDLIIDGPKEIISMKLRSLQEINKKALVMAKQEEMKREKQVKRRGYAKRFISRYTKMFSISRENMKNLVQGLGNEDILLLENTVLEKLKKPACLQVVGAFSAIGIFIGSTLMSFLFGNQAMIVLTAMLFFTGTGWLFPLLFLTDFFYGSSNNGEYGVNPAAGYIGSQRVFKNKYGPQYFPFQEVREELGLIED